MLCCFYGHLHIEILTAQFRLNSAYVHVLRFGPICDSYFSQIYIKPSKGTASIWNFPFKAT